MKSAIIILISLVTANVQTNLKCWDEMDALGFADFKGKVHGHGTVLGEAEALSVIDLNYRLYFDNDSSDYRISVCVGFNVDASWMIRNDENLLDHEQLHFDIAELYGRKMKKIFSEGVGKVDVTEVQSLIECTLNDLEKIQKLYDSETLHGSIRNEQSRWSNTINKELVKLDDSKTDKCSCN